MLRFLAPYRIIGFAIGGSGGAAYGAGAIGVPILYALVLVSAAVTGAGFVRWEERQHPQQ
jgi:hypothetical protein